MPLVTPARALLPVVTEKLPTGSPGQLFAATGPAPHHTAIAREDRMPSMVLRVEADNGPASPSTRASAHDPPHHAYVHLGQPAG